MNFVEAELYNERLCCGMEDPCNDSSIIDVDDDLEIDDGDDDADTYLRRNQEFDEFIDEFYDVLEDEAVEELINENGITGAGYALLADLDAQGAFI